MPDNAVFGYRTGSSMVSVVAVLQEPVIDRSRILQVAHDPADANSDSQPCQKRRNVKFHDGRRMVDPIKGKGFGE
jgi:hypothetical protein